MHFKLKLWAACLCAGMLLLGLNSSQAQPCDDSCPQNNLVTNGDFQAGNTGFTTGFNDTCGCNFHSVCVSNEPRGMCNNFIDDLWDHTLGNSNGRYLIVDGREFAGQNPTVWANTVSVANGTTYSYSFWLRPRVSSLSGTYPYATMQMFVNGVAIGGTITGTGTAWTKFCNTWTSNVTGNITIEIRQLNNGGIGWDFGIDDIFFGACAQPCEVEANFDFQENNCVFDFIDQSTAGNSSTSIVGWLWKFGDGCSSTEQNPTHVYERSGVYQVCLTVTAYNPETEECCVSTICREIEVNCEPEPCEIEADFTWSEICDSCIFEFNGTIITANRNISGWFWDFGDGTTGAGQNVTHSFPGPGTYQVCLTVIAIDEDGCCTFTICKEVEVNCEPFSQLKREINQGLFKGQKEQIGSSFQLFPNPGKDYTTISYTLDNDVPVHIEVLDIQGKTVKVLTDEQQHKGAYQLKLDASDMPAGTYFINMRSGGKTDVKQLMIQK